MELDIKRRVSLAQYTTLHVGGVADYFVTVSTMKELREAWHFARVHSVPVIMLGGGSNVLIAEGEIHNLVIKNELRGIQFDQDGSDRVLVTAAAGEPWDSFVAKTTEQGLSGLENLSGIPGTVGASPVQNINAYGVSVADTIVSVEVYDGILDEVRVLKTNECTFGYRDSLFKKSQNKHLVVTAVTFALSLAPITNLTYRSSSQSVERYLQEKNITTPQSKDVREAILHVRHNIGMLEGQFRSAGSFFKNTIVTKNQFAHITEIVTRDYFETSEKLSPWYWHLPTGEVKIATAFLLECSPFNKHTYGNKRFNGVVGMSPLHSLSVVTEEGATATDVLAFVDLIKESIKKVFEVELQVEVDFIS